MDRTDILKADITKSFDNHIANYWNLSSEGTPNLEIVRFQQPGTNNYFIEFILTNGTLFVRGDLGEAAYRWYGKTTFPWLSTINMDYMMGKCQASEVGRRFVQWDEGYAREKLKQHIDDYVDEDKLHEWMLEDDDFEVNEEDEFTEDQYAAGRGKWRDYCLKDILSLCNIDSQQEWVDDINRLDDPGEVFGDQDYWEWAYDIGEVPNTRMYCHYIGLRLAIKKLQEKGVLGKD